MLDERVIPAEEFLVPIVEDAQGQVLTGGGVSVKPRVSIHGSTVKIALKMSFPMLGEDSKTFVLSKANRWSDTQRFFSGVKSVDVSIAAETASRRIHVRVHKNLVVKSIDYDHYVSYANFTLPSDFKNWTHADPKLLAQLKQAASGAQPVKPRAAMSLEPDRTGPADACALLGGGDFMDRASSTLGQMARPKGALAANGRDSVLFALGILDDAAIHAGGFIGTGFWVTDSGRCGWYSTVGGQMGSVVGFAAQVVLTVVWATGSDDAVQNFSNFQLARGIVGEGAVMSFGLLGDISQKDINGIVIGGGIGLGTPAGAYVGAGHQFMIDF